jgi:hypothetical protein
MALEFAVNAASSRAFVSGSASKCRPISIVPSRARDQIS